MITLATRLYSNAILRTGARVPLREALRGNMSGAVAAPPAPARTPAGPTPSP